MFAAKTPPHIHCDGGCDVGCVGQLGVCVCMRVWFWGWGMWEACFCVGCGYGYSAGGVCEVMGVCMDVWLGCGVYETECVL